MKNGRASKRTMSGTSLDRLQWAVEIMDIQPGDQILEIGCGRGNAVRLVAEKLSTGHITAIDCSEKMTTVAEQSNAELIVSGVATILNTEFPDATFHPASFRKIFLFNINLFWMDPAAELNEVRRLLRPNGIFYIFHQPPPGHEPTEYAERFRENLSKNKFEIRDVIFGKFEPIGAVCVISRPS